MKTNKRVLLLFVLITSLMWCCVPPASAKQYKIALIHSYEEGHVDAARTLEMLSGGLRSYAVFADFREYYLNCDELGAGPEKERVSLIIDDCTSWGVDLIAVFDDQATYSLLACNNPQLRHIPVVFGGVNYPNEALLKQYPNVTGYADVPDYLQTLRMVERIMGKSRLCVINGRTVLDKIVWKSINEQCQGQGIHVLSGGYVAHVQAHRTLKDALFTVSTGATVENERLDTTAIVRIVGDSLTLTELTWTGRGTHTYFLFTKRDFTTLNSAAIFQNFCFETINEGFGEMDHMMGGYFAPLETQMKDMVKGIHDRLRGVMPPQQVQHCAKQYVLNWHTMQRYRIPLSQIPEEYVVMYIPFRVRYHTILLYSSIFGGITLLGFIFFLSHSLIVERRRKREAQRNLQLEHETLALAIEGAATYAWRIDGEGIVFDAQFGELIHHEGNRFMLDQLLSYIHPDDRNGFIRNFLRMQFKSRHKGQYRCRFTGTYQWWEFRYNTIQNPGTDPVIAGLLQNIQDVKDREEELIQARELAEHAELKQSFLNNMSHEIRTPLNAIAGFSSMLVGDPDLSEEEKQEFVDIINLNTRLLLKLIEDVLELSRIESGALSFTYGKENVRAVLESIYQTHSLLIHPPLEFLKDFPQEDVFVNVDSMRLTQVLTNFLNNAHKFTTEGFIKLGFQYRPELKEVSIFVEDTGIGISAEEQKIVFERFYKHNEFSQGVGLGLSISTLIVEKLEGRIEVESQEGKGSRFIVILPCVD